MNPFITCCFLSPEVFCQPPPQPPPGASVNLQPNETAVYQQVITYNCGPGRTFRTQEGLLYENKELECQWDTTWGQNLEVIADKKAYLAIKKHHSTVGQMHLFAMLSPSQPSERHQLEARLGRKSDGLRRIRHLFVQRK